MFEKVKHTAELERILNLPKRGADPPGLVEELTALLRAPGGTQTLRETQARAIYEAWKCKGLFGPVGVGEGKTLISLLMSHVLGAKRPLLVLPASLIRKTELEWKEKYSEHWLVPAPRMVSYEMLGRVQAAGYLMADRKKDKDDGNRADDVDYRPDLLIFDEVHRLKNKKAACTRRVVRYMQMFPNTIVVALSGTIMRKSLLEFGHILRWCLKERAPIPSTQTELEEWAAAIDEKVNELDRFEVGALTALCPGTPGEIADVRRGFQQRLIETPGVVSTIGKGEDIGASLYINALRYEVSDITDRHFARLRDEMITPGDWPLSEAVDVWRHARELSLGLHYAWVEQELWKKWLAPILRSAGNKPDAIVQQISNVLEPMIALARSSETLSESETMYSGLDTALSLASISRCTTSSRASAPSAIRSLGGRESIDGFASITITERARSAGSSASRAIEPLAFSETASTAFRELLHICLKLAKPPKAWLNARREWNAFVRETLTYSKSMDSELQVANACDAGKLDATALKRWREIKPTFTPSTIALWHDDTALNVCLEWMKKPGIVWTEHDFFARRLAERSGCKYYGAKGRAADGTSVIKASPTEAAIVSMDANREGKNLQEIWNRNLVTCPPEGADVWQQFMARTHRPGTVFDEVIVDVLLGCREHANAFKRARAGAQAIKDTTGAESKLLTADISWPSDEEIAGYVGRRWG